MDAAIEKPGVLDFLLKLRACSPDTDYAVAIEKASLRAVSKFISLNVKALLEKPVNGERFSAKLSSFISMPETDEPAAC